MAKRKLTAREILDYEVRSSKINPKISNKYLQSIIGWWIGRRVNRKYDNYIISLNRDKMIEDFKRYTVNIKCPECSGKLEYVDYDVLLLSDPPQRHVKCTECSYFGYVPV